MKRKTSITLSEAILEWIDRSALSGESRSQAIERLLRERLMSEARRASDLRDLAVINENAAALNAEAEDVLAYQAEL